MSTKAPRIAQPCLRNKHLSALEENLLRMRFGWQAQDYTPVNRSGDITNAQTLKQLSHLEARLRVEAQSGRQHPRRSPKD